MMNILFAGGGTGGHVFPAIAVGQAAVDMYAANIFYIGNKDSFESRTIEKIGWPFYAINIQGLQRSMTFKNAIFPFKLLASLWKSRKYIRQIQPDIVVGTGGYASGPPLYMAARLGIPVVIQEQNSFPGVTSKILGKYAQKIYLGFKEAIKYFPEEKCVYSGNPIRQNLVVSDPESTKKVYGFDENTTVIFIFGGSQGSHSINLHFSKILKSLCDQKDVGIIWQTGPKEFAAYQKKFQDLSNVRIFPFIEKMAEAYTASDFCISRSGALTLAELAIVGLPAILIPFPHATGNHQFHNAMNYENEKAAIVIEDKGDYSDLLFIKIKELLDDKSKKDDMSARIRRLAAPDAAHIIAKGLGDLEKRN